MFFETNEKFHEGFALELYKDVYSITSVQKGTDGKEYKRWAVIEIGADKRQQKIPLAVKLGEKDMAVEALRAMLNELIGTEPIPDDDVPF